MHLDPTPLLAHTHRAMKRSEIRELLKLTRVPDLISFGGGLPDPTLFPVERIREVTDEVLRASAVTALQYGTTEGDDDLRDQLVERYRRQGFGITREQLVIVTGSQQALDMLGKVFVNPGDIVLCGAPTYLGALGAFMSYGAQIEGITLDDEGMSIDELRSRFAALEAAGQRPKFLYTVPDFQNPSGIHMSLNRRREIVRFAAEKQLLLVEDSPYREFNFSGEELPSLYEMTPDDNVIHLGTFSKTFMPGLRIGWIIASPEVIDRFVIAKQNVDLCSPSLTQMLTARFLVKGYFDDYLQVVKHEYGKKKTAMVQAFERHMPQGVRWNDPQGGLFLFLTFPRGIDSTELFPAAVQHGVSYVPGRAFFADGRGDRYARINFSYSSVERNEEGVRRLAAVIREAMAALGV